LQQLPEGKRHRVCFGERRCESPNEAHASTEGQMKTACRPLAELTAADVMSREVIAVPKHLSLRAAVRLLAGSHISGAPVVNHTGRCVGVLSTTDFVNWAGKAETTSRERGDASHGACEREIIMTTAPVEELVRDWMTPDPVIAPPTANHSDRAWVEEWIK
jgi:CBS-domain-containing membrane protein